MQDAAPYHAQGEAQLHATCEIADVQQAVATAVGDRIADSPRLDPTTIPGVTVDPSGGDISVASNPDACVGALDNWGGSGGGVSHAAREAAINAYAQMNPGGAARIHDLLGYISHWAWPAALGGVALLGGTFFTIAKGMYGTRPR